MSDDTIKIVKLEQPKNELQVAGDAIRRNQAQIIENCKAIAKIRRAAYLAYIEEGFTPEEALKLCTQ